MTLPHWDEPRRILPSPAHLGEANKEIIHLARGRALNEWENLEQILAWIFRDLMKSESISESRAYGTLTAGVARRLALEASTCEFFHLKTDPVMADYWILYNAYGSAANNRNNIAHGICQAAISTDGGFNSGWFLYPLNTIQEEWQTLLLVAQVTSIKRQISIIAHCGLPSWLLRLVILRHTYGQHILSRVSDAFG